MKTDRFIRVMLVLIFLALVANFLGPWLSGAPAYGAARELFGEDVRAGSASRGVTGVAAGDVDNDGLLDLIILDNGRIYVKMGLRPVPRGR